MQQILESLNGQMQLLNFLCYEFDISRFNKSIINDANISKGEKKVGKFSVKKQNLLFLERDRKQICNISEYREYSKDKSKNIHVMCHTEIKDGKNRIDCYNGIKKNYSDNAIIDNYISIKTNNNLVLSKTSMLEDEKIVVNYEDKKVSFYFEAMMYKSKIIVTTDNCTVRIEKGTDDTYLEIEHDDGYIGESDSIYSICRDNSELFKALDSLIKKETGYNLFLNAVDYMKTKNKIKVYRPE